MRGSLGAARFVGAGLAWGVAGCQLLLNSGDPALFADADASVGLDARGDTSPTDASEPVTSDGALLDGGAANLGISCGLDYCAAGAQACCFGVCTAQYFGCVSLPEAGAITCSGYETCSYQTFECDDTADCSGNAENVCCGVAGKSRCLRLADCRAQTHVVYCDPLAVHPCPDGARCDTVDAGRPRCEGL